MDWTSNDNVVRQIVCVLQDTLSGDSNIQKEVGKKVEQFRTLTPEYANYLAYILLNPSIQDDNIRLMSGLLLKNTFKTSLHTIPTASVNYIKNECLKALSTVFSSKLRNTLCSLVSIIVSKMTMNSWVELTSNLPKLLSSKEEPVAENAITTLVMLCEDIEDVSQVKMDLGVLFPILTNLFTMPNNQIRGKAVRCMNHFLTKETVAEHGDIIIPKLVTIWEDEDDLVRKEVCGTFVLMIEHIDSCDLLCNNSVIEYMLRRTCDLQPAVALQACEFWLSFSSLSLCKVLVMPHLSTLVPILIAYMKYSEEESQQFLAAENTHEPDSPEEIKPLFHRTYKDSDDEIVGEFDWTIRKCAAASLDALAVCFRADFLPIIIPLLQDVIEQDHWPTKEAGILGLGAIAEGCGDGISHFLPEVVPYLMEMLNHREAAIRSITCWTLSRYSSWVVTQENFLEALVIQFLNKMLDRNKKVQQAACSAYSVLLEEARADIVPFIELSLNAFVAAFDLYQLRSLIILYDSIGTLAHAVGNFLDKPQYISLILPPLIKKWNCINNDDKALLPLLECMTYVIAALELGFLPYSEPVYDRCRALVEETLWKAEQYRQNPAAFEEPDNDFVTVALDLISGIVVGLKSHFSKFLTNSNLVQLVYQCIRDASPQVRQSSIALYGDLVKYCYANMQPFVNEFLPVIIENIDRKHEMVCNNAIWAIGEICLKMDQAISAYVATLFPRLVEVLENPLTVKNATQTAAVVLCCLGFVCPTQLAPQLPRFIRSCCMSLRNICDCTEKDTGFRGICQMIAYNPQGIVQDFIYFCDAVASWNSPKEDLRLTIVQIMNTFKGLVGDENWKNFLDQCPLHLKERLKRLYGVM